MQDIFEEIFGRGRMLSRNQDIAAAKSKFFSYIRPEIALENLFYEDQLLLFQKRTAVFMRCSFPAYAQTLTEEELEKLAIKIQERAALKGFFTEKEIWHYLIAAVYCGFFFEQDAQYTDILRLIGWHENGADKMLLLDKLLSIVDEYALECEKDFVDFGEKLKYLAEFYEQPQFARSLSSTLSLPKQKALGIKILTDIFPQRLALWTHEVQDKVMTMSLDHIRQMGFSLKEGLFYIALTVYFGRGFEQSPLYPWAYFLQNRDTSPQERIKQFNTLLQKHFGQLTTAQL